MVHAAGGSLTCAGALDWNCAAVVVAPGVTHDVVRVAELALEQVASLDAPLVAGCLAERFVAALAAAMVPAALMEPRVTSSPPSLPLKQKPGRSAPPSGVGARRAKKQTLEMLGPTRAAAAARPRL